MAQRKVTPKPMHVDATVHVTNDPPAPIPPPSHLPFLLSVLEGVTFIPAAFEPRVLVLTAVLHVTSTLASKR